MLTASLSRHHGRSFWGGFQKATPLLKGAAQALLHECEVGDFIGGARTGSKARNCELLIGDTYQYPHGDGSGRGLQVIYQAPEWGELRQALAARRRSLRTLQYALSCTGQAYGLAARMENLTTGAAGDPGAVTGVAAGWDYAVELLRRATLAPGWATEGDGGPRAAPELTRFNFVGLRDAADSGNKAIKAAAKKANGGRYLPSETEERLDEWLAGVRDDVCRQWSMRGAAMGTVADGVDGHGHGHGDGALLAETLELIGSKVPAEAVDLLVASGSSMYNLATGGSDVDYFVVFTNDTRRLLDRSPPVTSFESHVAAPMGANKVGEIECTGRELGSFLVDLSKGNPQVVELLFMPAPQSLHESTCWAELRGTATLTLFARTSFGILHGFLSCMSSHARRVAFFTTVRPC